MNNSAKVDYTANGVTTVFSFPFWVMLKEDITVVIDDIIQTSGFIVNGILNPSGGNVEFDTPPINGAVITLLLTPVPVRLVTYQQNGDLAPVTLNNDFDRVYLLALSNNTTVARALSLGLSDIDGQGSFRARNNRITGLGAPVTDSDAVRKIDVVDLVKPYDDNARASADRAEEWALAAAQSAVNSVFGAERAETAAESANSDALRAEAAADSIDPSMIEQLIEDLAYALTVHENEPNPHNTAFYDLLNIPVDFPPSPHRHAWPTDITGFDPKYFSFVTVVNNPASTSLSIDVRANYGDGIFFIRTAMNNYFFMTAGGVEFAQAGTGAFFLGNVFVSGAAGSTNYIRTIFKLVKN